MNFAAEVQAFLESPGLRFAEVFMSADPDKCVAVERSQLAAALPARKAMFDDAGVGPLHLVDGQDEDLGEGYVLARTVWRGDLSEGGHLDLRSTYVLRTTQNGFEVVFYLNHQDLPGLLAARAAQSRP